MSKLTNGEQRPCRACGKRFIGAATDAQAQAPIELEPDANGNVLLQRSGVGVRAFTFGPDNAAWLRGLGVELRMNHFASCPERARFTTPTEGTGA